MGSKSLEVCVLFLSAVIAITVCDLPVDVNKKDWVNPHAMFKDDIKFKDNLNKLPEPLKQDEPNSDNNYNAYIENLQDSLAQCELKLMAKQSSEKTNTLKNDLVFMRRFVSHLLYYLNYEDENTTYVAKMHLRHEDYEQLFSFSKGQNDRIHDVDAILGDIFYEIGPEIKEPFLDRFFNFVEKHGVKALGVCLVVFLFICLVQFQLSRRFPIGYWLIFLFLASIPVSVFITYQRLYHEALSKKLSDLHLLGEGIPKECYPHKMTLWETTVTTVLGRWERCEAYHRIVNVPTIYDVTPLAAIEETICMLVLSPVEHMGTALGKFYGNLLKEQSWLQGFLVMTLVTFMIIFIVLLLCNYRIGIPFLFYIEPGRRPEAPPPLVPNQRPMIEEVAPPVAILNREEVEPIVEQPMEIDEEETRDIAAGPTPPPSKKIKKSVIVDPRDRGDNERTSVDQGCQTMMDQCCQTDDDNMEFSSATNLGFVEINENEYS